jgi:hypothetical protein
MGLRKGAEAILRATLDRPHEKVAVQKNGRLSRQHGRMGALGMLHDVWFVVD